MKKFSLRARRSCTLWRNFHCVPDGRVRSDEIGRSGHDCRARNDRFHHSVHDWSCTHRWIWTLSTRLFLLKSETTTECPPGSRVFRCRAPGGNNWNQSIQWRSLVPPPPARRRLARYWPPYCLHCCYSSHTDYDLGMARLESMPGGAAIYSWAAGSNRPTILQCPVRGEKYDSRWVLCYASSLTDGYNWR